MLQAWEIGQDVLGRITVGQAGEPVRRVTRGPLNTGCPPQIPRVADDALQIGIGFRMVVGSGPGFIPKLHHHFRTPRVRPDMAPAFDILFRFYTVARIFA